MDYSIFDVLGSVGVVLLLLAYLLLQVNKVTSADLMYSLLNALGAGLILISLTIDFNASAFAIEFFWLLISLVGMVNYFLKNRRKTSEDSMTADLS